MSRHKKSATSEIKLVGSRAQVDAKLAPEGTVLVHGELWRAALPTAATARHHDGPSGGMSGTFLVQRMPLRYNNQSTRFPVLIFWHGMCIQTSASTGDQSKVKLAPPPLSSERRQPLRQPPPSNPLVLPI